MSTILLTQSPYRQSYMVSSNRRTRRLQIAPLNWKFSFGPKSLIVVLGIVGLAVSMMYLAHFNQVATKGYDLKRLEIDRQSLLDSNESENMRLADVKSMNAILTSNRIQRMVNVRNISYVHGDTAVASLN